MAIVFELNEKAEVSNRELIKGIEDMNTEDRIWIIERLNHMNTFSKEIWHFKTAALKLSKRELEDFQMLDLLKECNLVQNSLLKKLNK